MGVSWLSSACWLLPLRCAPNLKLDVLLRQRLGEERGADGRLLATGQARFGKRGSARASSNSVQNCCMAAAQHHFLLEPAANRQLGMQQATVSSCFESSLAPHSRQVEVSSWQPPGKPLPATPGSQSTAPAQTAAPGWSCRSPSPPAAPACSARAAPQRAPPSCGRGRARSGTCRRRRQRAGSGGLGR